MRLVCLAVLAIAPFNLGAQVTVQQSVPNGFQYGLSDLFSFTVLNTGETTSLWAKGEVRDHRNQLVLRIETEPLSVSSGSTLIRPGDIRIKKKEAPNAETYQAFVSGSLPPGSYTACIRLLNPSSIQSESCREVDLKATTPPRLVYPRVKATISEHYPVLTWMPAVTLASLGNQDIEYSVFLFEVLEHQSPEEAALRNRPLFRQSRITNTHVPYPSNMPPLQDDHRYVWQVRAVYDEVNIGQSETWVFTIGSQPDELPEKTSSLIILGDKSKALDIVHATQFLQFQVESYMTSETLNYTILDDEGKSLFKRPKTLEHRSNQNAFSIDLYTVPKLRKGQTYTLLVKRPSGTSYPLRFIYSKR